MLKRGYSRMGVEFARNLSGNARLRIAILGQAPPISTLSFVVHTREKAEVSRRFLSENLFGSKLGKERWPLEAMILLRSRSFELLSRLVIPKRSPHI